MTSRKTTRPTKATQPEPPTSTPTPISPAVDAPEKTFSIVGMGASAGGLEAFENFFRSLPAATGLAFVLVPHLDPNHASILTEILQRTTAMPVIEAQDQMSVAPDHVYVIPPNRDLSIFHGALQLAVPEVPRGQRMPIDAFLRSLAEDQGERAIGIVLSGTGTDGTQGLRAILGAGGVTLVQEPASAKYDGMPTSALRGGYATHVLAVEKMPAALLSGGRPARQGSAKQPAPPAIPASGMSRLLQLLRSSTGHDFSLYKKSTIGRRIERRMAQHELGDIEVYTRYLKEHPAEVQALFKELLINVTNFFRDPEAFVALKQDVLPPLLADKAEDDVFRVWVTGCATGEEAYSIAIVLRELIDETRHGVKVQIYSTDLDEDAIAVARAGHYPPNIAADVTPERLHRFFVKEEAGYRIKKEIREMVVFAVQNVIKDPPFTRLDLLCCRNLMIYLEPELQNRLIPAFHYALKRDGVLFLSPSENIGNYPELFAPLNRKWKLYRAVHTAAPARAVMTGGLKWAKQRGGPEVDEELIKVREINLAELTRRVLQLELRTALHEELAPTPGKNAAASDNERAEELARDLAYTRENLQSTIEEQQASNEELQSTNEELQSTNEELETSKEELQSLNEELVTVNAELQAKIEQLAGMQNDMKNLLDNISVGTVFLDDQLQIRRFTREAARVYRLVASDVGRPLVDIKSDLEGEDLLADARAVLDTLVPIEREVWTSGGAWYLARLQPYRTLDNVIDGVVLTFSDISRRVAAEATVQAARLLAESIVDTVREPLLVLDGEMQVVSASRAFYTRFAVVPEETVGRRIYELGDHQWDIPALRQLLDTLLPRDQTFDDFVVDHQFPRVGRCRLILNARRIVARPGEAPLILLAMEDAPTV